MTEKNTLEARRESERFGPERFLRTVRTHWAAGSSLHWVLHVTMDEDRQRSWTDSLALMRWLALYIARVVPKKEEMCGKLKKAGWNDDALMQLVRVAVRQDPLPRKS